MTTRREYLMQMGYWSDLHAERGEGPDIFFIKVETYFFDNLAYVIEEHAALLLEAFCEKYGLCDGAVPHQDLFWSCTPR